MHEPKRYGRALLLLATLTTPILLPSCGDVGASETESVLCREIRTDLPTYSVRDTPETLASGARFLSVFESVCPTRRATPVGRLP